MSSDNQFTALGPAEIGFQTDGANIRYGVNVQGTEVGVYAEGGTGITGTREAPAGTGLFGIGNAFGVFGNGNPHSRDGTIDAIAGVFGESNHGRTGVIGVVMQGIEGAPNQGVGVAGLSMESIGNPLKYKELPVADGGGNGVFGASGSGVGVFGQSDAGDGVVGESTSGRGAVFTSSSGDGVVGESASGRGAVFKSDSGEAVDGSSNSGSAVVGRSTSNAGGFFNSFSSDGVVGIGHTGVRGQGSLGNGVLGRSQEAAGVWGESEKFAGVIGKSPSASGVFGFSENNAGVVGKNGGEASAPGVYGESEKFFGVIGKSTSASGVLGLTDAAFNPSAPPAGVVGVNDKSVGVLGSSVGLIGTWGNTDKGLGVVGTANLGAGVPTDQITGQGIGVIGLANSGFGAAGMSTSGTGVFGSSTSGLAGHFKGSVTIEGVLTIIGGSKSAAVPHPDGSHRQLYCMESPESWFEDFGEAQLVGGKADVRLDPDFAALVEVNGYHVFLTPYGDSNGMFVAERYATGFRVCEQQGGTSSASFAYRVVARRKDIVADRLAAVTVPEVSGEPRLADLRVKISPPDLRSLAVSLSSSSISDSGSR